MQLRWRDEPNIVKDRVSKTVIKASQPMRNDLLYYQNVAISVQYNHESLEEQPHYILSPSNLSRH